MKLLLSHIESEIAALSPEDVQSHIWWNKFREMVLEAIASATIEQPLRRSVQGSEQH